MAKYGSCTARFKIGCAIAQAVSCWLPTEAARVQTWRVQITMLLNMQFSSASSFFIPLRSKYSHQHLQSIFCSSCEREILHPHKTTGQITVLCILIFTFLDSRQKIIELNEPSPKFDLLLISSWMEWFVSAFLNILILHHFQRIFYNNMLQFCPAFWWWDMNIYLCLFCINSRKTLLFIIGIVVFFIYDISVFTQQKHWHGQEAYTFHSVLVSLDLSNGIF
jgi:hypothetical protein